MEDGIGLISDVETSYLYGTWISEWSHLDQTYLCVCVCPEFQLS